MRADSVTEHRRETMNEADVLARARGGDRAAIGEIVRGAKDRVFNLAVRMLADRADAEDATQEILMRVVSGLSSFRGDSSLQTWIYRVASNHLLTARKRKAEERFEAFDAMAAYLDAGIASEVPALDDQLLVKEAKMRCTQAMLLCLDRDHRLAFVLGEVLEMSSEEGAEALDIAPDAFRKRLSRARERMEGFLKQRCGLYDERLPCRCAKQAACALQSGRLDVHQLWAKAPATPRAPGKDVDRVSAIFRSLPEYAAPASLLEKIA
jgi:RNA polymerase sigma factor (sigma-70 family)